MNLKRGYKMKNLFLTALTLMLSISAHAICCKAGAPWNGHGNYSESVCVANGNQYIPGDSCTVRNDNQNIKDSKSCPRGKTLFLIVTNQDELNKCIRNGGVVVNSENSKLCCR